MSTSHTAEIYIENQTGGQAFIQMSHRYSGKKPEAGSWLVNEGDIAGPLTVSFETGAGTGFDSWYCSATVFDGMYKGIYATTGSLLDPEKKCMMKAGDAGRKITFVVTENTFHMTLPSGACSTGLNLLAPYSKLTNVFVLMLENHSFDHLFGFTGSDTINGLTGDESNMAGGEIYYASSPAVDPMPIGPGHEFQHTLEQLCGKDAVFSMLNGYPPIDNSGFVESYSAEGAPPGTEGYVMRCCDSSEQVPMLYKLAKNFVICDNWFSSMPGPTWPNRLFAMGASSAGLDDSPSSDDIKSWNTGKGFHYPNGSVFDQLLLENRQFRVYSDTLNQFSRAPDDYIGSFPIVLALDSIHSWDINKFFNFKKDLQKAYPYEFTWIEPNYGDATGDFSGGSSQHPTDSLKAGEKMIAAVYDAIRTSPYWATSMLIITYDEHGGYYDHVAPPPATPPGDDHDGSLNTHGFDFDRFGVRVPAVVVSPLTAKGVVTHTLFDHTSIIKTVQANWSIKNSLTQRDAKANHLLDLLKSDRPRTDTPMAITAHTLAKTPGEAVSIDASDLISTDARPSVTTELDARPLPERGNIIGFLHIALKCEIEMSDGSDVESRAIIDNFKATVRTYGDARAYFKRIATETAAFISTRKDMVVTEA